MKVGARDVLRSKFSSPGAGIAIAIMAAFSLVMVLAVGALFLYIFFSMMSVGNTAVSFLMSSLLPALCIGGVIGLVVFLFIKSGAQTIRLGRFAADNGFEFVASKPGIEDGIFRDIGHSQNYTNQIFGSYGTKSVSISNYSYTVSSNSNNSAFVVAGISLGSTSTSNSSRSRTYSIGVTELTLPRALPNILLDSKKNNLTGVGNLSQFVGGSQKLSLEGDFDSYFTLYVPANYERDTLYFLTPELMQLLIDEGRDYDIEIVGNKLKLYRQGGVDYSETGLKTLFAIIDTLGGEFIENTARYTDEKSAVTGAVAIGGQRLKKNNLPALVGIIIFVIIVILQFI
jgi:hypothetical protein